MSVATYIDDAAALVDSFRFERCELCGGDLDRHLIAPDPLGKPHLFCLDAAEEMPEAVVVKLRADVNGPVDDALQPEQPDRQDSR